jgi:predicted RNA binding protein YcfA (HicA-like mRNA interferase family)
MKVRDVIKEIEKRRVGAGSNARRPSAVLNPTRPEAGTITVPGHPGDDMPAGTLNSILKKAGLK